MDKIEKLLALLLIGKDDRTADIKKAITKYETASLRQFRADHQYKLWGAEQNEAQNEYIKAKNELMRLVEKWDPKAIQTINAEGMAEGPEVVLPKGGKA